MITVIRELSARHTGDTPGKVPDHADQGWELDHSGDGGLAGGTAWTTTGIGPNAFDLSATRRAPGDQRRHDGRVQISARGDYAVRATLELASAYPSTLSAQALADAQGLPRKFLEAVLADLRRSGVVHAVRGADGGYVLSLAPTEVTIGMVLRAVDGPLAGVRGHRPETTSYTGTSSHLPELWVAVRAAVRSVVDEVSLTEVMSGELPARIKDLTAGPDAWQPR